MKIIRISVYRVDLPLVEGPYNWSGGKSVSVFDSTIEEASRPLGAGEVWLFFTDGVSEAMNAQSDMFGEERLMRLLEDHHLLPPADLQRRVEDEVLRFTGNRNHADDLTMVLVKVA